MSDPRNKIVHKVQRVIYPLTLITPLSKGFSLVLFVVLPFVGGWIGYTYAPEKIVESIKVVNQSEEDITTPIFTNLDGFEYSDSAYYEEMVLLSEKEPSSFYNRQIIDISYPLLQMVVDENSRLSEYSCLIEAMEKKCYLFSNNDSGPVINLLSGYRNLVKKDYVTLDLLFQNKDNFYFISGRPDSSSCCRVVKWNSYGMTFEGIEYGFDPYGGDKLSPSMKHNSRMIDEKTLEIYDYEQDRVFATIKLNTGESLYKNMFGYSGPSSDFSWLDDSSFSYGVYRENSEDAQHNNELIEYRVFKLH